MAESMGDLLAKRSNPQEPKEFGVIREFVAKRFNSSVRLETHKKSIVIKVDNAPLAGALRLELYRLQELCSTDKKLFIRIGS